MYGIIDPVSIIFYACVCAGLAAFVTTKIRWTIRLLIGGVVGVGAACLLPFLRSLFGF